MAETLTELVARISTDATELKRGLSEGEKATEASSKRMADSLKKVGIAMAAAGAAITAALGLAVKSAMEAVESENLFTVSLKNNADAARKWSNDLGKSLGLNTFELRKNVGIMFTMISSMGVAEDAAFDMSKGVTELANDMASFYNLPTEEAFAKLKSGLVGMPRPLQDLGILVNETTIKTWALTNGLIAEGQEMTEQQKVTARYGAILEATSDAQGDLARTIDSPTNKLRILGSAVDELRIVIGENLLPVVGQFLNTIGTVVKSVIEWVKENPKLAQALTITAAAIGLVSLAVGGLILLMPALTASIAAFGVATNLALAGLPIIIGALTMAGVLLWQNWDKVSHFLADIWSKIKLTFLEGIETILSSLEKFTSFIPWLGDKVSEARQKISGMIGAEKIERDAELAKRALEDVEEAIEDTTEILAEHTEAVKVDTAALEENLVALQEQKDAYEKLIEQVEDARKQYTYENSEAGKLRITTNDVTNALIKLGWTNERIANLWHELGDDVRYADLYLKGAGLTAQGVSDILGLQAEAVEKLTKKYTGLAATAVVAMRKTEQSVQDFQKALSAISSEVTFEQGLPVLSLAASIAASRFGVEIPSQEQIASVKAEAHALGIPGYQQGGVVENTGLAFLHEGERVIPEGEAGGITINFTQPVFFDREDTMNRFVDMIRKGIQRQDRLKFGGAYNGK